MISKFQQSVYDATKKIPKGKVSTYAEIARMIKKPRAARAVGNALNCNPFPPASTRGGRSSTRGGPKVPCHRVVRSDGTVGGFADGSKAKIKILSKEGIMIKNSRIINFRDRLFTYS